MHKANANIVKEYPGSNVKSTTAFGLKYNNIQKNYIENLEGKISTTYNNNGRGFDFDFFIEPTGFDGKTVAQLFEDGQEIKPREIIIDKICNELVSNGITKSKDYSKYDSTILE